MDEPEISECSAHLAECSLCQQTIRSLPTQDTPLEMALRREQDRSNEQTHRPLIERLKRIPRSVESQTADDDLLAMLEPAQSPDEIGRIGHYRIMKLLGSGGMGAVFSAIDPQGKCVALKLMLPRIAKDHAAKERFLREAWSAAKIRSQHIVTIYEVLENNGTPFLTMELLAGRSLESQLHFGGPPAFDTLLRIASETAQGLADAHREGLIHRDIKPANLWLEEQTNGKHRVKILDFGLARPEVDDVNMTFSGAIVGTPAFMSPEQARSLKSVDARSDLFSLGCVLYLMCTGQVPFRADTTVGTLMAIVMNEPKAPHLVNANILESLSDLVMDLLAKEPSQRPQSAMEVVERLAAIQQAWETGHPLPARTRALPPPNGDQQLSQSGQIRHRRPIMQASLAIGLLSLIGLGYCLPLLFRQANKEPTSSPLTVVTPPTKEAPKTRTAFDEFVSAMRRLNPDYDGASHPIYKGDELIALSLTMDNITNIAPISQLRTLQHLALKYQAGLDGGISDLSTLKGLPLKGLNIDGNRNIKSLEPLAGMPLVKLQAQGVPIADLSPLKGMPLEYLDVWNWAGADLSPLKGLPLKHLNIGGNHQEMDLNHLSDSPLEWICFNISKISDLSPLKGLPLTAVYAENTLVQELSPLAGKPLTELIVTGTPIRDFSVVKDMPLTWIKLDFDAERDEQTLRAIKTLVRINDLPAAAFWETLDAEATSRPVPTAPFTNKFGMEFEIVAPGKSKLGGAGKLRDFAVDQEFYLGRYEVTQAQWTEVMSVNPSWFSRQGGGASAVHDVRAIDLARFPVEMVSWPQCQEFVKKLNQLDAQDGWTYRLPTSDEWEYACRGGPITEEKDAEADYYFTQPMREITAELACFQHAKSKSRTRRVGQYEPNRLGLFDMHGNVWEMCDNKASWMKEDAHEVRGGSWRIPGENCKASTPGAATEPSDMYDVGLRVGRFKTSQ